MDKITLTTTPALPSKCVVCNNDAKSTVPHIDFGTSLDYYGAITICSYCIVNAAELVGMIPVAKFTMAEDQANAAIKSLSNANRRVRVLELLVAEYTSNPNFSIDSWIDSNPDVTLFEWAEQEQSNSSGQVVSD